MRDYKYSRGRVEPSRKARLDRVRGSLKSSSQKEDDLFTVWRQQDRKEKASQRTEANYKAAKKKLRETRKAFAKDVLSSYPELQKKATKAYKNIGAHSAKSKSFIGRHKVASGVLVLLVVAAVGGFALFSQDSGSSRPATLGADSSQLEGQPVPELTKVEDNSKTVFPLLYPAGVDEELYEIVLVSPPGADQAYTYLDRLEEDGPAIRVTQQRIPDDFNLEQVAENFQATNTIQVDDAKIKHGYSERGRTQSLFFIKDDLLVSVRSPILYEDDVWVSYYLSLET